MAQFIGIVAVGLVVVGVILSTISNALVAIGHVLIQAGI